MRLERLSERVWVFPYEERRDRPNLCYIKGDNWNIAVDAGHSADHVMEFYKAIEEEGFPLPKLTVLTHWHWDHTFGMHAVSGLTLANVKTNRHLEECIRKLEKEGPEAFLNLDQSIRYEYEDGKPIIVKLADMTFSGEVMLDPGNCPVRVFEAEAPHTDDSTLIYVPGDKALILGDCTCGSLPEWKHDPVLSRKLADTVRQTAPQICLTGHWTAQPADEVINDLLEEDE